MIPTKQEDRKDEIVLSSHDAVEPVHLLALDTFDYDTLVKIRSVASSLFCSSLGLDIPSLNINARVVDALMAYLLLHYLALKQANANGLAVQRSEASMLEKATSLTMTGITEHPMFRQQAALME
ncbi:hypothetical protein PHMEG_0003053 [Phytophthora megakarya]|uniref:Uncharacterized protein n=1 Tax=Phytophthora megakarya TaxID=4795 RepID=A0A225WWY7_9STRA|nr:hypothetical protein PHMEG_0003053 [Phytophthora megakarya]